MDELSAIKCRYDYINRFLNEKTRRLFLASEAKTIGWGGIEKVSRATGVSSDTISKGCKELEDEPEIIESGKIRKQEVVEKSWLILMQRCYQIWII